MQARIAQVFNASRWEAVYQQAQRWINAGSFEAMVHDLRVLLRLAQGRNADPSAAIFNARTIQSPPESGGRAGYDGQKHKKGSKVRAAVDTLSHLLALHVTPANEQERAQVSELAQAVQEVTGQNFEIAFVDQGYTGEKAAEAAQEHGIQLEVVKLPEAKTGSISRSMAVRLAARATRQSRFLYPKGCARQRGRFGDRQSP